MAITGAQLKKALQAIPGAATGQIASWDQLAAGADDAMRRVGCKTVTECALFLATMAQESGYFRAATEYGSGQRYAPYVGRTFQQVTWKANYAAFGRWAKSQGLITDANLFVNNPKRLAESPWWWMGGVWFWTANHGWSGYSSLIDVARKTGSIWTVSRAVNGGNPNWGGTPYGMNQRTALFNAFKSLGSGIVPGLKFQVVPTTASQPASQTAPAQAIPGSVATVLAMANKMWNQYKGRYYGGSWPGWKELNYQHITSAAWCAAFIWLCLRKSTGYDWSKYCSGPAYTPALDSWMRKSPAYSATTYAKAVPGDIVFFLDSRGVPYHIEIVEFAASPGGHDLRTIGGNTSTPGISQSMSNGGTLAKKVRDDRYLKLRLWHPTYWVPVSQTVTPEHPTTDTDAKDPADPTQPVSTDPVIDGTAIEVVTGQPTIPAIDASDVVISDGNPLEQLRVSESFRVSRFHTANKVCKVDAYLGSQLIAEGLPVNASQSKISVTTNSPVRRRCSLELLPGRYTERFQALPELLATPGVRLRVYSGFAWGGADETVPVGEFLCDDFELDEGKGTIKIDQPDTMALVGMMGFGTATALSGSTYVDTISWLVSEADAGAKVIDLTGNTDKVPYVLKDSGPTSRIDTVMDLTNAIGAEFYKSPVAGYYVLRPVQRPGAPARWSAVVGRDLKAVKRGVKNSRLRNEWNVYSERSDQAKGRGVWRDVDHDSATRIGGPFGYRVGHYTTSLIPADNREAMEQMAAKLGARTMGANVDLNWEALANPLAEGGDPYDVITDAHTYRCVLDSFDLPLGAQRVAPAAARTLSVPGGSQ